VVKEHTYPGRLVLFGRTVTKVSNISLSGRDRPTGIYITAKKLTNIHNPTI